MLRSAETMIVAINDRIGDCVYFGMNEEMPKTGREQGGGSPAREGEPGTLWNHNTQHKHTHTETKNGGKHRTTHVKTLIQVVCQNQQGRIDCIALAPTSR